MLLWVNYICKHIHLIQNMPYGTVDLFTKYVMIVHILFPMEITSDNGHGLGRSTQRELEAPKTTRPFKGEQLEIERAWTNQLHLSLPRASSKFQHVLGGNIRISSPGYSYYDWVDHRWKGEPEMKH
jgi:hypothetical protein